ncbi:MAG TPA: Txe/YoeB family addiction module toxin [Tepidiformaceae bacterium]|nr:Txe/YoeB family addiction module toxin [Tepidiformaceae bacterium]
MFSRRALKDLDKLRRSSLRDRARELVDLLRRDPFAQPPRFEALVGDLAGAYSRRINVQHRLVYQVFADHRTVRILSMWTHYE